MTQLILAVVVFLLTHMIPALPRLRAGLVASMGRRVYLGAYSVLSLVVLAWVGHAYAQAPYVPLWDHEPRLAWVPAVVMFPALLLVTAGLVRPNPLSLGRAAGYDPTRPGVLAVVRHPVPWGLALWAGAHMAANGDVAAWILFGLLLILSLGGMAGLDAKKKRQLGEAEWRRLAAATSAWPFQALLAGRVRPRLRATGGTVMIVVIAAALYRLILALHEPVIGVSPWPPQ
ncbi:NnrU family protein [Novispirillum sp. DQ9]|uniref:NnrU family protein n=1 Tax=Novispirillum sp. DQ9 TaxID=3398612 RepID=UPI003C7D7618